VSDPKNNIFGTSASETLTGTAVDDDIRSRGGNDYILAGGGDDYVNSTLTGYYPYSGSVIVYGGTGNDKIHGTSGNDKIYGEDGDDSLYGGDGNDTLDGGTGYDRLSGGDGDDTYIINSTTFYLSDSGGNDTAIVNVDFAKIPSSIENITYADGVQALPYWISALLPETAARYSSLLGAEKTYYFGFPTAVDDYGYVNGEKDEEGWEAISGEQKVGIRVIFTNLETLIDVSFSETTKFDQLNTLTFANNIQETSSGNARYPGTYFSASDVYIDILSSGGFRVPQDGSLYADTFVHEIGHAIGLKHPFDEPNAYGNIGPPPYLQGDEDHAIWTQMAYEGQAKKLEFSPLDIAALQYLYGVNPTTRAGDDSYPYSSTGANFIWDGAGTDTIDASSATEKVTIYLEPGYWGFGGEVKADKITSNGQITVNFGTVIENLTGSDYDDKLVGNASNNELSGGLGNDILYGGDGADKFDRVSKGGDDTFYGGKGDDQYFFLTSYEDSSDTIIEYENEGFDYVHTAASFSLEDIANVEALYSYSNITFDLSLTGNDLNNIFYPSKGNCVIDGKDGVDIVYYSFDDWSRADCSIFKNNGILKVIKGNGNTDTLINCEKINFSDQTVTISELQLDLVVLEFSPADDTTEIALVSDITVTFSAAIKRGTGDITLKTSDGTVVAIYNAASSTNLSISDKTLTINPSENLDTDTIYQVVFDEGSITDLNDNNYKQSGDYQFTTIETIPPTASSFSPNDDAIQVAVASDITITFSEAIKVGTGNITLKTSDGTVVATYDSAISSNLAISDKTLTINPDSDLSTDTTYQVVFDEGSITDLNGNKYDQSGDYKFTTIDTIAPTAASFSPADDATEIAVASDITVTFSEAIKRGTGDITLKTSNGTVVATYNAASSTNLSISDKTLTVNPSVNIETDTAYQLVFDEGAIVDINGNKYKQSGDYQFTTIETIKPILLSINKANLFDEGAKEDIVLTFSESIKAGTGSVIFKNTNTGASTEYKTASASNISITGSTLTIASSSLANSVIAGDIYTVEVDADAVTDLAGNKYKGLTVIYGRSGDDTFDGEGGNSFISGGAGTDKVEYAWDSGDYLISKEPDTGRIYVANKIGEELGYVLDDTELLSFRDVDLDTETISYIGKVSSIDASANSPVFRFYNTRDDAFFYTHDSNEKDNILNMSSVDRNNIDEWPYAFQGSTFNAASAGGNNTKLLHRFFNADTGHHLWSMDPNEIANIKNTLPSYNYEGPSFYVYGSDPNPSDPNIGELVYRYYNSTTGKHFWTADAGERNLIQLTGVWVEEGPAFWGE